MKTTHRLIQELAGQTLREAIEAAYGKPAEEVGVEGAELEAYRHDLDSKITRIYISGDDSIALVAGDTIWQDHATMNIATSIDDEEALHHDWTLIYPDYLGDLTEDMLSRLGYYLGRLREQGALTVPQQRERQDYIETLPQPLKDIAWAYVFAGRDADIQKIDDRRIGVYIIEDPYSEELPEPEATFTVVADIADAIDL